MNQQVKLFDAMTFMDNLYKTFKIGKYSRPPYIESTSDTIEIIADIIKPCFVFGTNISR